MNMESFNKANRFAYGRESDDASFSGILEIHVHHARNIHNICIYEKQDVYAKFSLTSNPDQTVSTSIINGGGKNPDFNQDVIVNINQPDSVLKCEIWMLSRAKNLMDDQLLGFVLVPVSSLFAKGGRLSQDFPLSSTDLFHSPAGTIKLSLFLNAKTPINPISPSAFADSDSSATSELLVDKEVSDEYCRIEFPDIHVVDQNQRMVSEYFAENGAPLRPWPEKPDGSFLHLGAPAEDYEMAGGEVSPAGSSIHNSGMTSLSDDRNSADSMEKKGAIAFSDFSASSLSDNASSAAKKGEERSEKAEEEKQGRQVKMEAEESAMQQQIVDMYMRSMQQFTESLAKMKLPMDLDKGGGGGGEEGGDVIQNSEKKMVESEKKDSCRVFYGSRAFF